MADIKNDFQTTFQVGIRTDPALAQNSTIKCCDFQALDVHLGEFNKSFTPFIVDSTPLKALIPRMNNFRHGIMQQGLKHLIFKTMKHILPDNWRFFINFAQKIFLNICNVFLL